MERVPRKKKKFYKKLWEKRLGYKVKINRSSIRKDTWADAETPVWGCEVYPVLNICNLARKIL